MKPFSFSESGRFGEHAHRMRLRRRSVAFGLHSLCNNAKVWLRHNTPMLRSCSDLCAALVCNVDSSIAAWSVDCALRCPTRSFITSLAGHDKSYTTCGSH